MAILAAVVILAVLLLPRWALVWRFSPHISPAALDAPARPVAIVFGAGLRRDGRPTLVLADRVATAVSLYHQGKVERLILSGSARTPAYDEPAAMRALALSLGVPDDRLTLDRQGARTRLTCSRAREVYGVDHALLVTQRFHLPRALALCHALGIDAAGVAADLHTYSERSRRIWELREYPASLVALLESLWTRPPQVAQRAEDTHGT
jgi:vancomycin permeability regulator SanA